MMVNINFYFCLLDSENDDRIDNLMNIFLILIDILYFRSVYSVHREFVFTICHSSYSLAKYSLSIAIVVTAIVAINIKSTMDVLSLERRKKCTYYEQGHIQQTRTPLFVSHDHILNDLQHN